MNLVLRIELGLHIFLQQVDWELASNLSSQVTFSKKRDSSEVSRLDHILGEADATLGAALVDRLDFLCSEN